LFGADGFVYSLEVFTWFVVHSLDLLTSVVIYIILPTISEKEDPGGKKPCK
jgi:hypothetical protein